MMLKFKHKEDLEKFYMLHPVIAGLIIGYIYPWIVGFGVEPVVTSTVRPKLPSSVSASHEEGRAVDIRVNDWPIGLAEACKIKFNNIFAEKYGAISYSDHKKRFAVLHGKGANKHLHFQIKKGLPYNALVEDFQRSKHGKQKSIMEIKNPLGKPPSRWDIFLSFCKRYCFNRARNDDPGRN